MPIVMPRPKFELAHIIKRFGKPFVQKYKPNGYILRILEALTQCRTSCLGGHVDACDCCGQITISYNSCRNRHCPKCQGSKQIVWADDLLANTLEVKHYHIVFTMPHELNQVCLVNSESFYNRLFASAWDTLRAFGYANFGAETGAVCILHTWGQNLDFHPHLHCIVPAVGFSLAGNWKNIGRDGKYLYPVRKLSCDFRGHFMKSLKAWLKKQNLLQQYQSLIDLARKKPWGVFCEPSMASPKHVVKYLGQYTHRVAISNNRIIRIDDHQVTFLHKKYTENARIKPISLDGVEFLRRFCMHILPKRFVKIRRFGVYSSRYKTLIRIATPKKTAKASAKESTRDRLLRLTGFDMYLCPLCRQGIMHCIRELPKVRSPSCLFSSIYNTI